MISILVSISSVNTDEIPAQGWGLLSRFSPFRYFPNFQLLQNTYCAIEYHVHIRQVSPQLSCGDTCQIWMRFKECNRYNARYEIKNFASGEIDEQSFSWTPILASAHKATVNPMCAVLRDPMPTSEDHTSTVSETNWTFKNHPVLRSCVNVCCYSPTSTRCCCLSVLACGPWMCC